MCGIAGFLSPQFSEPQLRRMTDALLHRGPDAGGYFFDTQAHVGLGHRRLSIIDLSEAANQPFWSACGRYAIVFNGEVYNFREIREALNRPHWRSSGDTEAIVEAFATWGTDCFSRFNGMFALAIWDAHEQVLTLARDRMGIKPLYCWRQGRHLAFASEIKSLRTLLPQLGLQRAAIAHYLNLGYAPDALTFFEGVEKLPAGSCVQYRLGGEWKPVPFWKTEAQVSEAPLQNWDQAKRELAQLIESAVAYRLISDVPIGTFLSGGIDSSTVTAFAQGLSSQPVKTFSIGFREAKFNESQYAKQVAQHLGTDHHEFILSEQDALALIPKLLAMHDQPFADSSAIPTYLVSEMARRHVTVALSGDGGDELFMGYGMYRWADRLQRPWVRALRPLLSQALRASGRSHWERAGKVLETPPPGRERSHLFSQEQYLFSWAEVERMLLPTMPRPQAIQEEWPTARALSGPEAQALFDLKHYLKDDLLVKVDIASMQHALEVRVPLLDYRIVAFSLRLHESLKMDAKGQKRLLKEVLFDRVPRELFDRPKWGFSIPLVHWLKGPLRGLLEDGLSDERVREAGVVQVAYVSQLKASFFGGKDYLYNRLWALWMLHEFLHTSAPKA